MVARYFFLPLITRIYTNWLNMQDKFVQIRVISGKKTGLMNYTNTKNFTMKNFSIFIVLMYLFPINSEAQNTPFTPPKGSPERKILLDLLRTEVEKTLGIEVIFEVKTLNVQGIFAFGDLVPRQKNGQAIDYAKTKIDPELLEAFDDWVCVLWQEDRNGNWTLRQSLLGATDLPYGCWWKEFGAPKTIFTYTEPPENCSND